MRHKQMDIIITGSSGFVGQNLRSFLLAQGEHVIDLSLRTSDWTANVPQSGSAIIHLAGKAHDTSNVSIPEDYYKINRDLTIQLFDRFLESEIKDFFYFSSVKAVADSVDGILVEDIAGKSITPYGKSKLEAEAYLMAKVFPQDKRVFIIRPCMIHGPGNKGNLNLLFKVVNKGLPWPLAAYFNQRSFLSIDNLCYLIQQMLIQQDVPSGVYNFADDDTLSTNDLVLLMNKALGKSAKLWHIPVYLIKLGAKIGDVLHLPLNTERLKKLTESYQVSNAKIKAALGISKLPQNAKDGLEKTIESFK